MDVNLINPLIGAFTEVLPMLGFQSVERKGINVVQNELDNTGILLNVALIGPLKGVILISMDTEAGKNFASKMMMGMPVPELDSMAQSAISEMSNMVCANACTRFVQAGYNGLDISPPTMMIGAGGKVMLSIPQAIGVNFSVDGIAVCLYLGVS